MTLRLKYYSVFRQLLSVYDLVLNISSSRLQLSLEEIIFPTVEDLEFQEMKEQHNNKISCTNHTK